MKISKLRGRGRGNFRGNFRGNNHGHGREFQGFIQNDTKNNITFIKWKINETQKWDSLIFIYPTTNILTIFIGISYCYTLLNIV